MPIRNSATRKHKMIQSILVTVAENLKRPNDRWRVQAYPEWKEETLRPDVRILFTHPKKGHFEVYCEVQKNRKEKSFLKKIELYKQYIKRKEIYSYLIFWEDEVPDDDNEKWDYLENIIEMNAIPW